MIILLSIGENDKIILVNTDDTAAISTLQQQKAYVITYGFNSKATLTASSVNENQMVLCLQRSIVDLDGREIEPQEFSVSLLGKYEPEIVMLAVAIFILSGISIDKLSKFMF